MGICGIHNIVVVINELSIKSRKKELSWINSRQQFVVFMRKTIVWVQNQLGWYGWLNMEFLVHWCISILMFFVFLNVFNRFLGFLGGQWNWKMKLMGEVVWVQEFRGLSSWLFMRRFWLRFEISFDWFYDKLQSVAWSSKLNLQNIHQVILMRFIIFCPRLFIFLHKFKTSPFNVSFTISLHVVFHQNFIIWIIFTAHDWTVPGSVHFEKNFIKKHKKKVLNE